MGVRHKKIITKKAVFLFALIALFAGVAIMPAFADASATTEVFYKNDAVDIITISVAFIPTLEVTSYPGGSGNASSVGITYGISTNAGANARKIMGKLSSAMETDLTLSANLTAPAGGSSAGEVVLTDADQALVTLIDSGTVASTAMVIKFTALTTAAVTASSKILTLTLTAS